jgi:hypothetical protein
MSLRSQEDHERAIFEALLELCSDLAGAKLASWTPGPNPPDFVCTTESGRKIAVELTEWLHEPQIEKARALDYLEEEIRSRVHWSHTDRFNVHLNPVGQGSVYPAKRVVSHIIHELTLLLANFDPTSRPTNPVGWWRLSVKDYPILDQYFRDVLIWPARRIPQGIKVSRASSYHDDDSFAAAQDVLVKKLKEKRQQYSDLKVQLTLDELILVLYYNRALLWNTPAEGLGGGIQEKIERLKVWIGDERGPFDKVPVFLAYEPDMQVHVL